MLRWFSNAHYARGINRVQIHSFGYSPPSVPLPGWRMYAEIHLNRNVTWWKYMEKYSSWARRLQWILQCGTPVADTLVFPVKSNPESQVDKKLTNKQPLSAINSIDAASEYTFKRIWENDNGQYKVSNLCITGDVKSLDDVKKINQMIHKGVKVSYCGGEPAKWSAFSNKSTQAQNLLKALQQAITNGKMIDAGNHPWQKVLEQNQSVKWHPEDSLITFLHRQVDGAEVYFIMNWGDQFKGEIEFGHADQIPQLWDADTGTIEDCGQWRIVDGKIRVAMKIAHLESVIIVFVEAPQPLYAVKCEGGRIVREGGGLYAVVADDDICEVELSDGTVSRLKAKKPVHINLDEGWKFYVSDKDGVGVKGDQKLSLNKLISWRQLPEISKFSGTAKYDILFDMKAEMLADDQMIELDLGKVYEVAEVWVNGKKVAVSWYPPYKVDITGYLKRGTNKLRVDVTNILKNYLTEVEYSHPSGLLGPVKIRAYSRISLDE
jgi:hypothetical protein